MRYAFFPGCSLQATAKPYDTSTKAICDVLNIELEEIPEWICCGASPAHQTDKLLALALPTKSLINALQMGRDVAVACTACYSRLRAANYELKEGQGYEKELWKLLYSGYRGNVPVKHLLDVFVNDIGLKEIEAKVTKKLDGLKVACYYGCLLTRPPKIVAFDDPEDPVTMDNLVTALGAEAVPWPYKTECCGVNFTISRTDVVLRLVNDILTMAHDAGAECIAVACPLCQPNLDMRQKEVEKRYRKKYNLPIMYFTQLVGLSFGISSEELGLNKLVVGSMPLLREKGLV